MRSQDSIVEEITVSVPKLRDGSSREAMARLSAFLQAVDIDCELDTSGSVITYGPRAESREPRAEGSEGEYIQSLINIFDARLRAVPTIEERLAAEKCGTCGPTIPGKIRSIVAQTFRAESVEHVIW